MHQRIIDKRDSLNVACEEFRNKCKKMKDMRVGKSKQEVVSTLNNASEVEKLVTSSKKERKMVKWYGTETWVDNETIS